MLKGYLALGESGIEIRYVEGERGFADVALRALEGALPSLEQYFQISSVFPPVTAVLVPSRDEFDRLVRDLLRVEIEIPSHPARIAQPQRADMVVLSPSAYDAHAMFDYIPDDFRRLLVHEMVHMVEEFLSPDIEASPRWWGEGLAVFLSEQYRFEGAFRQAALSGIAKDAIPSLSQIDVDAALAYDWGWTIVSFIETEFGREMIARIVRECADGNVLAFLKDGLPNIEKRWRFWLQAGIK